MDQIEKRRERKDIYKNRSTLDLFGTFFETVSDGLGSVPEKQNYLRKNTSHFRELMHKKRTQICPERIDSTTTKERSFLVCAVAITMLPTQTQQPHTHGHDSYIHE